MRYIGVSDCRMQEGSMRCDVNISVRPEGSEKLGTRTEIKNMNSITNIAKAMEYEYERQVDLIESGGEVVQETLRYDDATGTTSSMRSKEDAHDYRYFREPDLVTINVPRERVEEIKGRLPELPEQKYARYTEEYGIPEKDAAQLTKYRSISEYFDKASEGLKSPKTASNFIIGQIFRRLETEADKEALDIKTTPEQLNELCKLLESGKPVTDFVSESDMAGLDDATLTEYCQNAIASMQAAVADYKSGKEKALMAVLGNVMKQSRGRADAPTVIAKLKELIG